jgi:hypothetical protein
MVMLFGATSLFESASRSGGATARRDARGDIGGDRREMRLHRHRVAPANIAASISVPTLRKRSMLGTSLSEPGYYAQIWC